MCVYTRGRGDVGTVYSRGGSRKGEGEEYKVNICLVSNLFLPPLLILLLRLHFQMAGCWTVWGPEKKKVKSFALTSNKKMKKS